MEHLTCNHKSMGTGFG